MPLYVWSKGDELDRSGNDGHFLSRPGGCVACVCGFYRDRFFNRIGVSIFGRMGPGGSGIADLLIMG